MIRRRRQRAQTFVIAAFAMTAMLGALSMVVDAGLYFVIQRQLQNAADAAALDAVWFAPACFDDSLGSGAWVGAGCQTQNPEAVPTPPAQCTPPSTNANPCTAAVDQVMANWGVAMSLCAGPNLAPGSPGVGVNIDANAGIPPSGALTIPNVIPYVVTLSCDAPHWFGRVLPGIGPGTSLFMMRISVSSSAALGWLGPDGKLAGAPLDSGTATGPNTTTTLADPSKSWSLDQWKNTKVTITRGPGAGQVRTVSSNDATSLTVSVPWSTPPGATSTYTLGSLVARLLRTPDSFSS